MDNCERNSVLANYVLSGIVYDVKVYMENINNFIEDPESYIDAYKYIRDIVNPDILSEDTDFLYDTVFSESAKKCKFLSKETLTILNSVETSLNKGDINDWILHLVLKDAYNLCGVYNRCRSILYSCLSFDREVCKVGA